MKLPRIACFGLILLSGLINAVGQGFGNLNFERSTIHTDGETATLEGWTVYGFPYANSSDVWFNTIALDAPAVTLQGTNSLCCPAIQGRYSVLLQGGTFAGGMVYNTNGASVFQTGQIPVTSQLLTYWAGPTIGVSFNGQPLSAVALGSTASYTVWGVDVSAYAGQTGELRFTAPWQRGGMLDAIQFSATAIPEPSTLALGSICVLCLFALVKRAPTYSGPSAPRYRFRSPTPRR